MNKILEKHFVDSYPEMFVHMYGPANETCMHWGITCGDGWFILLDSLCHQIQNRINTRRSQIELGIETKPISQVVVAQIKEKFGTLRFYYDGGDDVIAGYVELAEYLSGGICEDCGLSNETVGCTTEWIRTLCPKCAKKYMSQKFREKEKFNQNKHMLELFKKARKTKK